MLKDFFRDTDDRDSTDSPKDNNQRFKHPSTWLPKFEHISPETHELLHQIHDVTNSILRKFPLVKGSYRIKNIPNNLTPDQLTAIKQLRNLKGIIIKPADKGGNVCLLDRTSYINEARRQLLNPKYYLPINSTLKDSIIPKINLTLKVLENEKYISSEQYDYLSGKPNDGSRKFYLLPKIHKNRNTWPWANMPEGRPIVSDSASESRRISDFITAHISPIAKLHPAYVKDSYDFIQKVRGLTIHEDDLLVTGDITSLYTNMNIDRTVREVSKLFSTHPTVDRSNRDVLDLLDITLRNNDFQFGNLWFKQILGMGMGKAYAPNCADVYLIEFDDRAMNHFRIKPRLYLRFIDDVFIIWPGSKDDLTEYNSYLNSLLPNITINLVSDIYKINFLDVTIFKFIDASGTTSLQTKIFFKETDNHSLLHKKSFHPRHTFSGILRSQILRFRRICSFETDFQEACRILFRALRTRGYSSRSLRMIKQNVTTDYNNMAILQILEQNNCDSVHENLVKFTTTNPILGRRSNTMQIFIPILHPLTGPRKNKTKKVMAVVMPYSPICSQLFRAWRSVIQRHTLFANTRLVAAYTKNKTLKDYLTSSSLKD